LAEQVENGRGLKCPLHGSFHVWSYHLKTNLSPFSSSALEFTLGVLCSRKSLSLSPSLRLHSVVKRSDSHLFYWFDHFDKMVRGRAAGKGLSTDQPLVLRRLPQARLEDMLSTLVAGVHLSIARGLASGCDSDEKGRNLLSVSLPYKTQYLLLRTYTDS
jgi:hypothetical protein